VTGDEYVDSILAKYAVPRGPNSPAERLGTAVAGPIRAWAGTQLNTLEYSGSYSKETGVHGVSDVDLFISLKADTTGTLKDLYRSVFALAQKQGWSPREQNVSIGVSVDGTRADLVPGKVQSGYQNYHSLYRRKSDSWTQTNVKLHIDAVRGSDRQREIRAVKTWRVQHGLEFPSLYLELFTIQALSGRSRSSLASNVLHVLATIGSDLVSTRIEDPANTNNLISDDLTLEEKKRVAAAAATSAVQSTWEKILW
jgi:hypothetical protein